MNVNDVVRNVASELSMQGFMLEHEVDLRGEFDLATLDKKVLYGVASKLEEQIAVLLMAASKSEQHMKVYIGKYRNGYSTYKLAELICFWAHRDEMGMRPDYVYKLADILTYGKVIEDQPLDRMIFSENNLERTKLAKFFDNINSKKDPRRVYVKIDNSDVWAMCSTLSLIIVPMLKKLKESQHGAPNTNDEDVPEELRSTSAPPKETEWDVDENHFKRWDWILDEMIWAFEQTIVDDLGMNLDADSLKKWINRKQNGYRLFGRYYENLWDQEHI